MVIRMGRGTGRNLCLFLACFLPWSSAVPINTDANKFGISLHQYYANLYLIELMISPSGWLAVSHHPIWYLPPGSALFGQPCKRCDSPVTFTFLLYTLSLFVDQLCRKQVEHPSKEMHSRCSNSPAKSHLTATTFQHSKAQQRGLYPSLRHRQYGLDIPAF